MGRIGVSFRNKKGQQEVIEQPKRLDVEMSDQEFVQFKEYLHKNEVNKFIELCKTKHPEAALYQ